MDANTFNVARLNYFFMNGMMNVHDEIPESVVHGGVDYFIAMKKKSIELDTILTYEQKEQAKLDCEKFYHEYELMLKSLLEKKK